MESSEKRAKLSKEESSSSLAMSVLGSRDLCRGVIAPLLDLLSLFQLARSSKRLKEVLYQHEDLVAARSVKMCPKEIDPELRHFPLFTLYWDSLWLAQRAAKEGSFACLTYFFKRPPSEWAASHINSLDLIRYAIKGGKGTRLFEVLHRQMADEAPSIAWCLAVAAFYGMLDTVKYMFGRLVAEDFLCIMTDHDLEDSLVEAIKRCFFHLEEDKRNRATKDSDPEKQQERLARRVICMEWIDKASKEAESKAPSFSSCVQFV